MGNIIPLMEQLNPNDLLIFARIAELGSFSRAAERIGLPKSTVSRRIAQLEEHLGERLILRTTRRLTFTEFGEQLLVHARQVASEVDAVTALSEYRHAQPTGRLRVSMPSEIASMILQDMLAAFVAMHPAVSLELDLSPRRVDLLAEGFDIALRIGELPDDNLLAARRLADLSNGLYASPSYLVEHGEPASPDELQQHKSAHLLGGNNEPLAWTLTKGAQRWVGTPPGHFSANSPELLVRMACSGCGIVAVPDQFALPYLRTGGLRRVLPDWCVPPQTAWAVFAGRRLMPTKTRAFITMLQHALNSKPVSS
jgi:DNA-binding transcriptional LysR family regulator